MTSDEPIPAATLVVWRRSPGMAARNPGRRALGQHGLRGGRDRLSRRPRRSGGSSARRAARPPGRRGARSPPSAKRSRKPACAVGLDCGRSSRISAGNCSRRCIDGAELRRSAVAHGLQLDLDALTAVRALDAGVQAAAEVRHPVLSGRLRPAGDWHPHPQAGECVAAEWASAVRHCSNGSTGGEASAIFPTKRNLERLAQHGTLGNRAGRRPHSLDRDDHPVGRGDRRRAACPNPGRSRLSGHFASRWPPPSVPDGFLRLAICPGRDSRRNGKGPRQCRGPSSFACRG